MQGVYNSLLWLSASLLFPLGTISPKVRHYFGHRLGWNLKQDCPHILKNSVWFHALSVGEVLSVVSLVQKWAQKYPQVPLFFTASTLTGHQVAIKKLKKVVSSISYFPLDFPFIIRRYLNQVNPKMVVLTETDIWPNFLTVLNQKALPCLLINARISERSYKRYSLLKPWFSQVINKLSFVGVQRPEDAQRFLALGLAPKKIKIMGSLKFDITVPDFDKHFIIQQKSSFGIDPSRPVWIAGSTHSGEDEIILKVHHLLLKFFPSLCLIIAPRHPERFDKVALLSRRLGFETSRRTEGQTTSSQVIILDTIGELAQIYALADLVFIGGSLVPIGGHNPLEAARWAKPIIWGPHMFNFSNIAQQMQQAKAAFEVKDEKTLFYIAKTLLENQKLRNFMGKQGKDLLLKHQGIGEKYLEIMARFL